MKWFLIRNQENQLCSKQMPTKMHNVITNQIKIQYAITSAIPLHAIPLHTMVYAIPLHTHDEDHFHHPQILKLASGTHTEWILNRDEKHNEIYQKVLKKLLRRQNINNQINSRFMPATDLKVGTFVLIPNFHTQKGISKKYNHFEKDHTK